MYDALILVNGEIPHQALWQSIPHRILICTDGAANTLDPTILTPDVIIGDMDSIAASPQIRYPRAQIIAISDQNTTDFEKALLFSEKMKYKKIICLGALGKSADHSLYNLSLLIRFGKKLELTLLTLSEEKYTWIFPLRSHTRIYTHSQEILSFFAFPEAKLTSQGLQWELDQTLLNQHDQHSLRNRTLSSIIEVFCEKDCLAFLSENKHNFTQWTKKVTYL